MTEEESKFVAVMGEGENALFLYSTPNKLARLEIECSGWVEDSLIEEPPEAGIWIWEGRIEWYCMCGGYYCDCEPGMLGKWRRTTSHEVQVIAMGRNPLK